MEKDENQVKKKRIRRTKKDLEQRLFDAALTVIEKVGFSNLTIKALTQQAKVEPPVFYNRYDNLNDFLDVFVRKYDYWLSDSTKFDCKDKDNPIVCISNLIMGLTDSLIDNTCMQRLLAWEINEDNHITRRTAQNRDVNSIRLIEFFNNAFKECDISFDYATAIIIGGIYYLIIHRERSMFNFIDYTKKENIEEMKKNIQKILRKIFEDYDKSINPLSSIDPNVIQIAEKLIENKVDYEIIKNSTGLSDDMLSSLCPSK